jgi:hypothetical protein
MIKSYLQFKQSNSSKIQRIADSIGEIEEESHWDLVCDMKSVLSSHAANNCSGGESAQEGAIDSAEAWVGDNCSDEGVLEDVAMSLWLKGIEEGEKFVRDCALTTT